MRVAVCIATCRRPDGLARLLRALAQLIPPEDATLAVLVVDNDPIGSARATVERARGPLPWPLEYVIEPRPGVSFARNAALDASAGYDLVAFIDDDETPDARWLAELVAEQRRTGAAAVCGPAQLRFETPPPAWIRSAFELCYATTRPAPTSSEISTNNVLLDRRALERHRLRFDERLSLIGGEDTMLGWDLARCGETIAWSEAALVEEHVSPARATPAWLLRRWYRTGNIEALLALRRRPGPTGRVLGLAGGLARIALGTTRLLLDLPWLLAGRRERGLRRMYTVCRGLGMVAGVFGRHHLEYRGLHGG